MKTCRIARTVAFSLFMALAPVFAFAQVVSSVQTPTVSTSAYTAGFVLGGIEKFSFQSQGTIQSVISDFNSGSYVGGVDWLLFNAPPTSAGTGDFAALGLTVVDNPKLVGVIHATDCKLTGSIESYCQSGNSPQSIKVVAGQVLYVIKQVIGTPTFVGAGDDTDYINVLP